jgi:hypothetical protein
VTVVDYRRDGGRSTYCRSGIRYHSARLAAKMVGASAPFAIVARAFGRVHPELVRAATAEPFDFIYGGTTGALSAIAEAARRQRVRYAIDLEDLHSAETSGRDAQETDALAARVERAVLSRAAFVTTSSDAIAQAYGSLYGITPVVIGNTFPLPSVPPDFSRPAGGPLRMYWFSQTIGAGRGLEDAVVALGRAGVAAELTLRGRPLAGYLESLSGLAAAHAPRLAIVHRPPAPPDAMVDLARGYDVGLALEQMMPPNRRLCVTNKAFTYILAGVAVAISDTPGQHALGLDLGSGAALVAPGDVDALAGAFAHWNGNPALLDCAKRCAWQAAVRRWHWEHDLERGRLQALVREAVSRTAQ